MDIKSKKIEINYTDKNIKDIRLINNGNIKDEEDYIFYGTDKVTIVKKQLDFNISVAIKEIKKYLSIPPITR